MGIMGFIWTVIVGLIVGAIARWLMPGVQSMGWIMTSILGIVGSIVGGFVGSLIWKSPDGKFHPAGLDPVDPRCPRRAVGIHAVCLQVDVCRTGVAPLPPAEAAGHGTAHRPVVSSRRHSPDAEVPAASTAPRPPWAI